MDIFSARLKWARENLDLSQKDIAEKIGMSPQGYGKIENGQREPNLETLAKLPSILGESVDFLIGVTDLHKEAEEIIRELSDTIKTIDFSQRKLANLEYERLKLSSGSNNDSLLHFKLRQIERGTEYLNTYEKRLTAMYDETIIQLSLIPGVTKEKAIEIVNNLENDILNPSNTQF
ncbi:Helix-turn-helix [Paenibacillus sophorae]|uniref:Helix-turn-helix n=1 Tax=Paenibacillus sophorae TaxID=1333845 RepID=A0A1H8GYP5_9BACL|nr:helix-turn-helix domain-containing protein [Paenibacillus sophorae]QWU14386.1 helix-turn-helix domain-containing protein [Paenibacillus sophorae]SEN49212.1 Helix-turn-helix [Paenibacillus sophorae]